MRKYSIKGGSWWLPAYYMRVRGKHNYTPDNKSDTWGFRLIKRRYK